MRDDDDGVLVEADLLARFDRLAEEAGVDRDSYIEDGLRRYLSGQDLVGLQREVSTRADVTFADALDLPDAERDAARAERTSGEGAGPKSR
ncbi:MAG: hypothetical protein WD990_11785 [Acidimicrobiia bacterium]